MSKRVTLTDREISYLVLGLQYLQKETTLSYPVIKAGHTAYQDIIDKLQAKSAPTTNNKEDA